MFPFHQLGELGQPLGQLLRDLGRDAGRVERERVEPDGPQLLADVLALQIGHPNFVRRRIGERLVVPARLREVGV